MKMLFGCIAGLLVLAAAYLIFLKARKQTDAWKIVGFVIAGLLVFMIILSPLFCFVGHCRMNKNGNKNRMNCIKDSSGQIWCDPDGLLNKNGKWDKGVKGNIQPPCGQGDLFYKQFKGEANLGEFNIQVQPPIAGQEKDYFLFKNVGPGTDTGKKVIMMQGNKPDGKTSFDVFKNMMTGSEQKVDDKAVEEFIKAMKTDKTFFDKIKGLINQP